MTPTARKRIACEFAIALMVCGAIRHFFIAPGELRAAELQSESAEIERRRSMPLDLTAAALQTAEETARRKIERLREQSRLATNQTELLSVLTDLARETGLSLDQFEPGQMRTAGATNTEAPPTVAPPTVTPPHAAGPTGTHQGLFSVLDSRIRVSGPYASAAAFLDLLSSRAGFTTVSSVRVEPGEKPGMVRVDISAEHFAMTLPVALGTSSHAGQGAP